MWNKREEVTEMTFNEKPEIIFLQETLSYNKTCRIDGYFSFTNNPTGVGSDRGICTAIKITHRTKIRKLKEDECFLACYYEHDKIFLFFNVYIPSNHRKRKEAMKRLSTFIRNEQSKNNFSEIYIGGDWNLTPNQSINILKLHGIIGIQQKYNELRRPTRRNGRLIYGRCLDYMLTISENFLKQVPLYEYDSSDHVPVAIYMNLKS